MNYKKYYNSIVHIQTRAYTERKYNIHTNAEWKQLLYTSIIYYIVMSQMSLAESPSTILNIFYDLANLPQGGII